MFGARPLKRAIQQSIENPLAQYILANELPKGVKLVVEQNEGELVISAN